VLKNSTLPATLRTPHDLEPFQHDILRISVGKAQERLARRSRRSFRSYGFSSP
jgi:hypothetical protein